MSAYTDTSAPSLVINSPISQIQEKHDGYDRIDFYPLQLPYIKWLNNLKKQRKTNNSPHKRKINGTNPSMSKIMKILTKKCGKIENKWSRKAY